MPILLPPAIDPLRDVHGAEIAAHLPDRDGASVKLPANITYVFIVFTNRSGSTFLGDLLAASGFFNFAEELLNHQQVLQVCAAKGWRSCSTSCDWPSLCISVALSSTRISRPLLITPIRSAISSASSM